MLTHEVRNEDCLLGMAQLADGSVDAVVTDPPYGLSFMGKDWDHGVPGEAFWREALRVAKPGAHLVAFGGSRTYHHLACAVEDAGWEIRDQLMWLYGTGFPKSLDVSKAVDRMDAAEEQAARRYRFTEWMRSTGATAAQIDEATGTNMGGHYTTAASQPAIMTREHLEACRHLLGRVPAWVETECDRRTVESRNMAAREVIGVKTAGIANPAEDRRHTIGASRAVEVDITAPATDAARQWHGWGTALKPAHEPIVLARKPLVGTVAENVVAHGVGALNVDGCRVNPGEAVPGGGSGRVGGFAGKTQGGDITERRQESHTAGRWPANVALDEEAAAMLDEQSGTLQSGKMRAGTRRAAQDEPGSVCYGTYGGNATEQDTPGDSGGASRFFFVSEGSLLDRAEAIIGAWRSDPASIAETTSDLSSEAVVSALSGAATSASLGEIASSEWPERTTTATPIESRRLCATAIAAMLGIENGCSLASLQGKPTQRHGLVRAAARCALTGTTTITISHWKSDGSAAPVIFSITPSSTAPGGPGSRFRFCAKASRAERGQGNIHPTVKPLDLMRWLVRLVCPAGGLVLDPFAGSGSTLLAAREEGCAALGFEREAEYAAIARERLDRSGSRLF